MGKKVERDILAAIGNIAAGPAGATGPAGAAGSIGPAGPEEIVGWNYDTMADIRGSNGSAMKLYAIDGGTGLVTQWKAPRAGTITRISGMLGTKVTFDAMKFGITRNGVDFYGSAAVTISSGASIASVAQSIPFFAGDVLSMLFAGGESFAPISSTPFAASFEVSLS